MTERNDDRLDELNGRVNDGFAKVDQRFIRLEGGRSWPNRPNWARGGRKKKKVQVP